MYRRILQSASRLMATMACLFIAACASTKTVTIPAPNPKLLATADAIVISEAARSKPAVPEGIIRGSGEGAGAATAGMAGAALSPTSNAIGVLTLPLTLPIAAAIGASRAHSAKEVDAAKQTFATVAGDPALLPTLDRRIAARIREKSRARWGCVGVFKAGEAIPCSDANAPARLTIRASYAPFLNGRYDPEISIAAMIEATLTAPSNASFSMRWRYDSPPRRLFELTANDGAALRSEITTMLDRLAQAVARDMIIDPHPRDVKVSVNGLKFSGGHVRYQQSNVPTHVSPGVVRRMHPQEPASLALDAGLKATILGKFNFWLGTCRIAKIDGIVPPPPRAGVNLQPGKSWIATAEPGEHIFTITCPTTGDDDWAPRDIKASVEAGRVYCTDGKSFTEIPRRKVCK